MSKKKLVADVSKYGIGNIANSILMVLKGIVIANVLGPALYGVWSTLQVILNWSEMAQLGIKSTMLRERTLLLGKGDRKKADVVRDASFSSALVLAFLFALAVIIGSFVLPLPPLLVVTSWGIALASIVFQLYSTLSILMRSDEKFSSLGKGTVLLGASGLVLTIALAIPFGIWGVIAAFILSASAVVLYFKRCGAWFRFRFDFAEAKHLVLAGLPLFAFATLVTLLLTLDKVLIAAFLNMEQVGYYTMGAVICTLLNILPSSLTDVVYPRTLKRLGESGSHESVARHALLPNILLAYLLPFAVGGVYMAVPLIIRFIAPGYMPAIEVTRILVLGAFFYMLYYAPSSFLIAVRREKSAIAGAAIALAVSIVVNVVMLLGGYGINGVAIGSAIGYFVLVAMMTATLLPLYPRENALHYFAKLVMPFAWLVGSILITNVVLGDGISIMLTVERLALLFVLLLPLAYLAEKETRAFSELKAMLGGK